MALISKLLVLSFMRDSQLGWKQKFVLKSLLATEEPLNICECCLSFKHVQSKIGKDVDRCSIKT